MKQLKEGMPPNVDLVLVFRSSSGKIEPKVLARQNARQASEQYPRLLQSLKRGGLLAVGKRGEKDGQLLVLVSCPSTLVKRLAQRERYVAPVLVLLRPVFTVNPPGILTSYADFRLPTP